MLAFQSSSSYHSSIEILSPSFCSTARTSSSSSSLSTVSNPDSTSTRIIEEYEKQQQDQEKDIGLYVHIPYCRRRCRYCNFAILPVGTKIDTETLDASSPATTKQEIRFNAMNQEYLDALKQELEMIPRNDQPTIHPTNSRSKQPPKIPIKSIYFGGGTPSLAPVETIAEILKAASSQFELQPNAEITIEMDPGTFSTDKLRRLKALGINRISLGVQSFDDPILEIMGRVHRRSDVFEAIKSIQHVFGDLPNYSIDLISGVPGLTLAKWIDTLQTALELHPRPTHISVYDLQVEESTVFGTWYNQDDNNGDDTGAPLKTTKKKNALLPLLPADEDCAFMYKFTSGYLKSKDFEHYEVSSYAAQCTKEKSSHRSQHNQIYWSLNSSWYAIGLGASSYVDGVTIARPKQLADYYDWIKQKRQIGTEGKGEDSGKVAGDYDIISDAVLKRLRTSDGLDLGT